MEDPNNGLVTDAGKCDRVRIFRGRDGIRRIRKEWTELTADRDSNGFYHLFDWYDTHLAISQDAASFLTIAVYSGDRLLGLLPVCESQRRFLGWQIRVLESPRTEAILHDAILARGVEPADVVRILRTKMSGVSSVDWDVLRLSGIPGTSHLARPDSAKSMRLSVLNLVGYSSYFELQQYRDLSKVLSRHFRAKLRKNKNRLQRIEAASFDTIVARPQLEDAFLRFIELEASGWKSRVGQGRGAIKLSREKTEFYSQIMNKLSDSNACHIHFLNADTRPIAGAYSILVDDTCFLLKIAYDEEFARISPGVLLMEYIVNFYAEHPDIRFINLISDSEWHTSWSPSKTEVFNCYLFNRTIKGVLSYVLAWPKSALGSTPEK